MAKTITNKAILHLFLHLDKKSFNLEINPIPYVYSIELLLINLCIINTKEHADDYGTQSKSKNVFNVTPKISSILKYFSDLALKKESHERYGNR